MKPLFLISSLVLTAGCGAATLAPASPPPPRVEPAVRTMAPGWARAGVLRGDWRVDGNPVPTAWLRPGGRGSAIYGVDLQATPSVVVIDDEPVDRPAAQRTLRLWFYQRGALALICEEQPQHGEVLAFRCDHHATIRYWRNASVLDVETAGPVTANVLHLLPIDGVAAPELEDADRQFARATAEHGAAGWTGWFADDGELWRGDRALVGAAAIEAAMIATLATTELTWQPTVSRLAPDGQSGFTAGTFVATARDGGAAETGTYVTLWTRTAAGWKVRFEVGRADH